MIKSIKGKILLLVSSIMAFAVVVGAEATSLLPAEVTSMITSFAADIVPTAVALLTILVPIGLTLWAVGFGVKKAIGFLQKKAGKAV